MGNINKIQLEHPYFRCLLIKPLGSYLTIGLMIYMISILNIYKEQLIKQHVAHEYGKYSTAFTVLLILQICLLLYSITDTKKFWSSSKICCWSYSYIKFCASRYNECYS